MTDVLARSLETEITRNLMKSFKSIVLLSLVFFGWVPQSNADEKKPFHFAHCGGAHEFEENTLFAFKNCYEKGIRGYELDVRMTRDIMLIKGGPLTPDLMEAAKAIGSRRIAAKMEGTTRLAVKEAQKQGFIVTGWPGHNLGDYFLGLGLGVDAICSDVPVQVQEYIESRK